MDTLAAVCSLPYIVIRRSVDHETAVVLILPLPLLAAIARRARAADHLAAFLALSHVPIGTPHPASHLLASQPMISRCLCASRQTARGGAFKLFSLAPIPLHLLQRAMPACGPPGFGDEQCIR